MIETVAIEVSRKRKRGIKRRWREKKRERERRWKRRDAIIKKFAIFLEAEKYELSNLIMWMRIKS